MKDFIIQNLAAGSGVSFTGILFKLGMALLIGSMIYIAYYLTSGKVNYNASFNFSLVAMAIITTAIMAVISSNIALSLGMVGALSIIRFRTAVKDTRDTMFIFWSIMTGICCGVSQYIIALTCTAVLFLFYLVVRAVKEDHRYILILRCTNASSEDARAITYRHYPSSRLSVQNTTADHAEFIYELKKFQQDSTDAYLKELYALPGIECVNFVLEEDKANI